MLDRIINIIKSNNKISDWKIVRNHIEATELFLIKNQIDMPRSKKVNKIAVTVYVDFGEQEKKYRGSCTVNIHPTMTDKEIEKTIEDAAFAASFVKNQHYPLPGISSNSLMHITSKFNTASLAEWMPKIKNAIYKADIYKNGYINSTEIFLNKNVNTIINSKGINIEYTDFKGFIEFITSWKESSEEIELYKDVMFSDFEPEELTNTAKEMLEMSREKSSTQQTPNLGGYTVILQGRPAAEVLKHYYTQANAQNVYNHVSTAKPSESIQGDNIKGDKINLTIDPSLHNSTVSSPVDEDGFALYTHKIIENGLLKKYWGTQQYCHYLNVEPTGKIDNLVFEAGSKTIEEMRLVPHLEVAAFSDFGIDTMTGDFAGEIRLGWYYDGNSRVTVSGGSISGNLKNIQTDMYLSKELQQCGVQEALQPLCYKGPKAIMMRNVSVAGN